MSLRINNKLIVMLFVFITFSITAKAGLTQTNPAEIAALTAGEIKVNGSISQQVGYQTAVFGELVILLGENTKMRKWEQNYVNYLESGGDIAKQVVAASGLLASGIETFLGLCELEKAISINKQGIIASGMMTNLYLETASELIETYNIIKVVADTTLTKKTHLLSGAERAEMIWQVQDQIKRLNSKLHQLAVSIACYSFEDVWNAATAGMLDKSHGTIAKEAMRRMQFGVRNRTKLYFSN